MDFPSIFSSPFGFGSSRPPPSNNSYSTRSPPPSSASISSSYAPQRSPLPYGSHSPAPHQSYPNGNHPPSSTTSSASSQFSEWYHSSLENLRSDYDRRSHKLGVTESRLSHCFEGGDAEGAAAAAATITREKKAIRELQQIIQLKEKRQVMEIRLRQEIINKFTHEKDAVEDHRRQIESIKLRLRTAFDLQPPNISQPSLSSTPNQSPQPSNSTTTTSSSSSSSSSSPSAISMIDLLARLRVDIGRHQVALEHQCLHVDSIEMQLCVDAANAYIEESAKDGDSEHPASSSSQSQSHAPSHGEPILSSPSPSPSALPLPFPIPPVSEDLTQFFKTSRKSVVTHLQAVLAEVDRITKYIKQTQEFIEYLKEQSQA